MDDEAVLIRVWERCTENGDLRRLHDAWTATNEAPAALVDAVEATLLRLFMLPETPDLRTAGAAGYAILWLVTGQPAAMVADALRACIAAYMQATRAEAERAGVAVEGAYR